MIYYYGTSLNNKGHYFWKISENALIDCGGGFPLDYVTTIKDQKKWPFDPEKAIGIENKNRLPLGTVRYKFINNYRIVAIEGSCSDNRPDSKSVFFSKDEKIFGDFVLKINAIPICRKIIKQMPFEVKWGLSEEYRKKLEELNINKL